MPLSEQNHNQRSPCLIATLKKERQMAQVLAIHSEAPFDISPLTSLSSLNLTFELALETEARFAL